MGPRSRAKSESTDGFKPATRVLDPGWATLIAAAFALLGTVVTLFAQCGPGKSGAERTTEPTPVVTPATTTQAPISTKVVTPDPSTRPDVPVTTATLPISIATSVQAPPGGPVVQVLSALTPAMQASVQPVNAAILKVANEEPLIVADRFATNDYAWPVATHTYDGGIQCTWDVADGAYKTTIQTAGGGAWCSDGLSKVASDFVLTVELQLETTSNSEIGLLFRVLDDRHYALAYSPQTQTLRLSYVGPEGETSILNPTYVATINKAGSNQITLLVIGSSMAVSVNGSLEVMISNETRITTAGRIMERLQLNEANQRETLSVTRFDLRGR